MKRIILVIPLLITLHSEGQIINASQPYRPTWAVSCSYLLDQYSGAAAAYSLRKLDCDYTGYAIRVRRSSDNSEQDIGFTSNGDLDTAALKTFVSTNSGYVVTWYDQSGNSKNATQSTAGNQPRIINSGVVDRNNDDVAILFDGVNDKISGIINTITTTEITAFCVWNKPSAGGGANTYSRIIGISYDNSATDIDGNGAVLCYINSSSTTSIYRGGVNLSTSFSLNTTYLSYSRISGTNSYIAVNGNSQVSVNGLPSTINSSYINLGYSYSNTDFLNGYIHEIILYNNDKSSNRTAIESNINSYYSIY